MHVIKCNDCFSISKTDSVGGAFCELQQKRGNNAFLWRGTLASQHEGEVFLRSRVWVSHHTHMSRKASQTDVSQEKSPTSSLELMKQISVI